MTTLSYAMARNLSLEMLVSQAEPLFSRYEEAQDLGDDPLIRVISSLVIPSLSIRTGLVCIGRCTKPLVGTLRRPLGGYITDKVHWYTYLKRRFGRVFLYSDHIVVNAKCHRGEKEAACSARRGKREISASVVLAGSPTFP